MGDCRANDNKATIQIGLNPRHAVWIKMLGPLIIVSLSDYLIQIIDIN